MPALPNKVCTLKIWNFQELHQIYSQSGCTFECKLGVGRESTGGCTPWYLYFFCICLHFVFVFVCLLYSYLCFINTGVIQMHTLISVSKLCVRYNLSKDTIVNIYILYISVPKPVITQMLGTTQARTQTSAIHGELKSSSKPYLVGSHQRGATHMMTISLIISISHHHIYHI